MTEIKCTACNNYHQKECYCILESNIMHPERSGMNVWHINKIWGITFEECKRFEAKA